MNRLAFAAITSLAVFSATVSAGELDRIKDRLGTAETTEPVDVTESGSATSRLGGLGDGIGGGLGGLAMPALGAGTAGNAAGVLQYCIKHKYLNADAASVVKDRLLGAAGLETETAEQDEGFLSGAGGILTGSDGTSLDLNSISDSVKDRACDHVLDNATTLLP